MNAVGIDVSKGKSMVAALRPFGEIVAKPFEVPHTSSGFHQLVDQLNSLTVVLGLSWSIQDGITNLWPDGSLTLVSLSVRLIQS